MNRAILLIAAGLLASACAPKYGCPAPAGVTCKPISEVYESVKQQKSREETANDGSLNEKGRGGDATKRGGFSKVVLPIPKEGAGSKKERVPVRSAPQLRRIVINGWIDEEGDYHGREEILIVTDHGKWIMGLPAIDPDAASRLGVLAPTPGASGKETDGAVFGNQGIEKTK